MINNYFKMFFITIYLVLNTQPVFAKKISTSIYGGIANNRKIGKYTSDAEEYLMMFFRPGYYIIDNLAFEPEIMWTTMEGTEPSLFISGNISYNHARPGSSLTPFLFVGYGIGNGISLYNQLLLGRATDDMDVKLFHLGAGLKTHLCELVALRVEYRYQKYSWESEYSVSYNSQFYKRTSKYDYNYHNIFLGFSIFMR